MKLITYETANGPRAGVVVDGQVLDIATLLGEQDGLRDVRALLELPNDPLTRLKSALVQRAPGRVYRWAGFACGRRSCSRQRSATLWCTRDMPAGEARGNSPMPGIGCRFSTSLTRFAFSVQRMPFPTHPLRNNSITSWSWLR